MMVMMLFHLIWIYILIISISCQYQFNKSPSKSQVLLQWNLGSTYPISKVVDPGQYRNLYCTIENPSNPTPPVLLMCPLSKGACLANCKTLIPDINIECNELSSEFTRKILHYRMKVNSQFSGSWKCQSGTYESRSLKLSITKKPYIKNLVVLPKPVWRGEPMNITCDVMPMDMIVQIHFYHFKRIQGSVKQRRLAVGSIPNARIKHISRYKQILTIPSAEPIRDDDIECMVLKSDGLKAVKSTKDDRIYYFPTAIYINASFQNNAKRKEGDIISIQCSAHNGYPSPSLTLIRFRPHDNTTDIVMDSSRIELIRYDNRAQFYCAVEPIFGRYSKLKSKVLSVIVEYEPDSIELDELPDESQLESKVKQFICQSKSGSEPPSTIDWSVTDGYGRRLANSATNQILNIQNSQEKKSMNINKSIRESVRVKLDRKLNGYQVVCSIKYKGKVIGKQKRKIRVFYSPDMVEVNSDPLGPILEGGSLTLTCLTESANPAPHIEWIKLVRGHPPINISSDAFTDNPPGNYSGIKLLSSLKIHGIARSDHGTQFRCITSHATMSSTIDKSYTLRVLYPPSVTVFSRPKLIEEGETSYLYCRTSGGNPRSIDQYRFSWSFCPVNSSYQINTRKDESKSILDNQKPEPPIDIRKQQYNHLCINDLFNLNNRLSSESLKYDFFFNSNNTEITINKVSSLYRGWYRCHVSLKESAHSNAVGYEFLDVQYAPIIVPLSRTITYWSLGSHVTLLLMTHANPVSNIKVRWFYRPLSSSSTAYSKLSARYPRGALSEKQTIGSSSSQTRVLFKTELKFKPYGRFESVIMDNFTIYLRIVSLRQSDLGEYSCEVSNRLGTKSTSFIIYSKSDISIDESTVKLEFQGHKMHLFYQPPTEGHFSHVILRICDITNDNTNKVSNNKKLLLPCRDMQISNPLSGQVSVSLTSSPLETNFRFMVFNGSVLLQTTRPFKYHRTVVSGQWVEMSMEMMVAVIVGVVGIFMLLFIGFMTLVCLKCRQKKHHRKYITTGQDNHPGGSIHTMDTLPVSGAAGSGMIIPPSHFSGLQYRNGSIGAPGSTTSSINRQHDFIYLNGLSSPNQTGGTTMLKSGPMSNGVIPGSNTSCHCFTNYPIETRSDAGSDHGSNHSQSYYHPMMLRRKIRDNGEMSSIHSGGSHQSPDLLLTERTSLTSSNVGHQICPPNQMSNGGTTPTGGLPNKISFLTGRMHSIDQPHLNQGSPEEFMIPNEVIFAAIDDPMNANQTRVIPIPARNFINASDYPGYTNFQLTQYLNSPNQTSSPIPQQPIINPNNNNMNNLSNKSPPPSSNNLDNTLTNNIESDQSQIKNPLEMTNDINSCNNNEITTNEISENSNTNQNE